MNIDDLKPNSHVYNEAKKEKELRAEKKVQKVVSGKVKTKKNEVRKFTNLLISDVGQVCPTYNCNELTVLSTYSPIDFLILAA